MENDAVWLWVFLAGLVAGGFFAVFIMSLMNIASYESDRAEMSALRDMPAAKASAND